MNKGGLHYVTQGNNIDQTDRRNKKRFFFGLLKKSTWCGAWHFFFQIFLYVTLDFLGFVLIFIIFVCPPRYGERWRYISQKYQYLFFSFFFQFIMLVHLGSRISHTAGVIFLYTLAPLASERLRPSDTLKQQEVTKPSLYIYMILLLHLFLLLGARKHYHTSRSLSGHPRHTHRGQLGNYRKNARQSVSVRHQEKKNKKKKSGLKMDDLNLLRGGLAQFFEKQKREQDKKKGTTTHN